MNVRQFFGGVAVVAVVAIGGAVFYGLYDSGPSIKMPLNDPGAGRLPMNIGACYIAKHQHRGEPCAEPKLGAANAGRADRVAAYLARALFDIGMLEPATAQREVNSAIALDGDNAEIRHLAARIALTLFDVNRADHEITMAHHLKPHDARISTTYAIVLISRRANREAVGVLDEVIRQHPDYLFAREQRATLFTSLGDCCAPGNYLVALKDYDYLIQKKPSNAAFLARRATVLLAIGKPEPAVTDLNAAIKLSPNRADLLTLRARAFAELGRDELSVKDYNAVLAEAAPGVPLHILPPDLWAKLLVERATDLVRLRRFDDAVKDVETVVNAGGKPAILRVQILLRRHGFSGVPIDGENSAELRRALSSCFGLKACYQPMMQALTKSGSMQG